MKSCISCPGPSTQGEQFDGNIFEISCSPHLPLSAVFVSAEQSRCFVHICCHFSPSSLTSFSQQLSQSMNFRSRDHLLQLKQTNNYCLYFTGLCLFYIFSFILYFFCNNMALLTATEFMVVYTQRVHYSSHKASALWCLLHTFLTIVFSNYSNGFHRVFFLYLVGQSFMENLRLMMERGRIYNIPHDRVC